MTKFSFAADALLTGTALFVSCRAEARNIDNRVDADGVPGAGSGAEGTCDAPWETLKIGATLALSAPAAAENEAGASSNF